MDYKGDGDHKGSADGAQPNVLLGGGGNFSRQGLVGGSSPLRHALESFVPDPFSLPSFLAALR